MRSEVFANRNKIINYLEVGYWWKGVVARNVDTQECWGLLYQNREQPTVLEI